MEPRSEEGWNENTNIVKMLAFNTQMPDRHLNFDNTLKTTGHQPIPIFVREIKLNFPTTEAMASTTNLIPNHTRTMALEG
jgi:hypothetical protein